MDIDRLIIELRGEDKILLYKFIQHYLRLPNQLSKDLIRSSVIVEFKLK